MREEILQKGPFTYSTSKLPENWSEKDLVTEDNQKIERLGSSDPTVFFSSFDELDRIDENFKAKNTFTSYLAVKEGDNKLLVVQDRRLFTIDIQKITESEGVTN